MSSSPEGGARGGVGPERSRVAIVTGGARGIGLAIATRLAGAGWAVALLDVQGDAASQAAARLRAGGARASGAFADVTDTSSVGDAVAGVLGEHGRIDALVNNAGVLRDAPLVAMTDEQFAAVLDVSLTGAFRMCRAVAPAMVSQGHGRIVSISSRAYLGNPGQANYSAAKAGLVGLTKALAKELGRHAITVNAVAPGMVDSDMVRRHPKADAIIARAVAANSVPRIGAPDDIAEAVAYLCSDAAGYITGDVLHVTGGRFG